MFRCCSTIVGLAVGGFGAVGAAQGSAARVAQFRSGLPRDNRLRARAVTIMRSAKIEFAEEYLRQHILQF